MSFDKAFHELLGHEGGYVDHPDDPGGETNWGITVKVARAYGYEGSMKHLPVELAKLIYKNKYWNNLYDVMPYCVAFNIFDAGVNHGVRASIKMLQKAVGQIPDGVLGPKTLASVLSINHYRVLCLFNAERLSFYTDLKTFGKFGRGWTRRVSHNLGID